jgi:predicted ATP-grasp superfamily ATP-dependent carboligase
MYTGALENHPSLIQSLPYPLWGNPADVLRQVRDPVEWSSRLASQYSSVPRVSLGTPDDPTQAWVRKPRSSAGGMGVVWLDVGDSHDAPGCEPGQGGGNRGDFFQQAVSGVPCSGTYVSDGRDCCLLGVTRQLLGTEFGASEPFQYAGSVGPCPLRAACRDTWERLGRLLAATFQLRGVWGIDAVVAGDLIWPVEINPRYTASMEVLERASSLNCVALHLAACGAPGFAFTAGSSSWLKDRGTDAESEMWAGKLIVYAPEEFEVTERLLDWTTQSNSKTSWPAFADLPSPGHRIDQGAPVLTVFAECPRRAGMETLVDALRHQAAAVLQLGCSTRGAEC